MADTKISAATDAGTLVGTDRVPLARSGSTTAYSTSLTALQGYVAISPYTSVPYMDGAGAAGGSALYSRGDHVHPSDTSKASLSGAVFTGPVTLAGDATAALHAVTKQQLDALTTAAGYAPLASPVFTGNPQAPTPAAGDSDTSLATTQFVQSALPHPNVLHNFGFAVNQRGYTSGTALAAAAYGFDRWKAGSGGCTLTFTASPPTTTVTITAGSLQQIVEGAGVRGGNHTLSWTGTAQGRIGAGSYAASPVTASLTAGANATVEFNTGTLSNPKLEEGATATPLARRDPADELALCQRFFQAGSFKYGAYGAAGWGVSLTLPCPVTMRTAPGCTSNFTTATNITGQTVGAYGVGAVSVAANVTATGAVYMDGTYTASADL